MNDQVEKRVTGFLGLCMRAGQLQSGQEACVALVRQGGAKLVLMDEGVSENTRKRMMDTCHTHEVPLYELSDGALGHAIGKASRRVIALSAGGMAQKLLELLENEPRL